MKFEMKRKIDELGRIVLPIEFRKALNVDTKCDTAEVCFIGVDVSSSQSELARPVIAHKQQNMNMIGHNHVLIYAYITIKFV